MRREEAVARRPVDPNAFTVVREAADERRLADPGFAADDDEPPGAFYGCGEVLVEVSKLRTTFDKPHERARLPRLREAQIDLARRRVRPA
jgi:hypothetical protein